MLNSVFKRTHFVVRWGLLHPGASGRGLGSLPYSLPPAGRQPPPKEGDEEEEEEVPLMNRLFLICFVTVCHVPPFCIKASSLQPPLKEEKEENRLITGSTLQALRVSEARGLLYGTLLVMAAAPGVSPKKPPRGNRESKASPRSPSIGINPIGVNPKGEGERNIIGISFSAV